MRQRRRVIPFLHQFSSKGEFAYLERAQRYSVVRTTIEAANGRVPVIAGVGSTSTADAVPQAKSMESLKLQTADTPATAISSAVIGRGEYEEIKAMQLLADAARWEEKATLPSLSDLSNTITSLPSHDSEIFKQGQPGSGGGRKLEARFTRPYQSHGSIGPSCAVGQASGNRVTVWTHTQGVFPDHDAIAQMLGLPKENVRCVHVEGSGCYGHNGAYDAAADAALIARTYPDVLSAFSGCESRSMDGSPI